jgi:hypothetical protein
VARARSSAGQSSGLIIRWSLVRIQAGPNDRHHRDRSSRRRGQGRPTIVSEGLQSAHGGRAHADAAKLHASPAEDLELKRELGLVNRRVRSYDPKTLDVLRTFKAVAEDADSVDGVTADSAKLHLRALEILKGLGKDNDYSADEYMLAIEQVQGAA